MYNILVCDDDKAIVEAIEIYLSQEGYHILKAYDGEQALKILETEEVHLLVLDVMMPRRDGHAVLREMRASGDRTPVIFLTARDSIQDRISGLDMGADDYLVKPFDFDELLARIRAATRKYGGEKSSVLT